MYISDTSPDPWEALRFSIRANAELDRIEKILKGNPSAKEFAVAEAKLGKISQDAERFDGDPVVELVVRLIRALLGALDGDELE